MKNTKKIITLALAAAMLSATGITAFAADPETKATNVSYEVQPAYTVTIPATVTLGSESVTADITASNVILEDGKQVVVALTAASNTDSGSTFNAKNGNSAVTYTISAGDKTIAVNDTVATFTANGSKTLTFSAADKSAATVAGEHTETLTFGISVENAVTTRTVTFNTATDGKTINKDGVTCSSDFDTYNNIFGSEFSVSSGQFTKIEVTAEDTYMTGEDLMTMNTIEGWSTTGRTATWTGKSSTVPFGKIMGNKNPVTIVFTIEE